MCPDRQMNSQLAAAFITQVIGAANPEEGMVHCPWIARPKGWGLWGSRFRNCPEYPPERLDKKRMKKEETFDGVKSWNPTTPRRRTI
ncbi:hypothetical protein I7I48_06437 [Histoplasma ohiense]|nr:hypothetical protein I7I48_06437 [Histoplasma ohiense (nom. inval.)]